MRDECSDLVEQIRAEEGNRGLEAVHLASGLALERYSRAGHEGAQNLVDKALDALAGGDRDRARTPGPAGPGPRRGGARRAGHGLITWSGRWR